ncbi:MAG: transporter substrate-binding domain-containing protein [Hydrogenophilales bacterium]|nr:transporter substrate-binding domain-containing protein [Hydrogenophilales bacterium]
MAWILALALLPIVMPVSAQQVPAQQIPPQPVAREDLTIDPATVMQPRKGDLDEMIKRRLVRVLVVPNKTHYFMDKGTQRGGTYDGFRLIEQELNKKLEQEGKLGQKHLKVRFVFIPMGRERLLRALADGKGDIAAANLTVTPERLKLVDFTVPTLTNVSEVVITGPASPAIARLDDLAGKEIFVRKSSSYHESLVALNQRFAAEKKAAVILKEAPETLEDEDLIEMLNAGLISVLIVDKHKADFWRQVFPKITVHDDLALRTGGEVAWAVRKGNPQLKAMLDEFAVAVTSGKYVKQRERIYANYLKNTQFVKDAASEKERRKFLSLIDFFQKYGDKYDVDWLLMAAQGYQESALNQKARSHVGAIGVMQIMPATGKELKVGDIRKVEANIHGGIKYMRWMIDQYYGKEPMTRLDKALFAFASYNAGAGRISQLRREAAQRGLDPNVWFHNVEYVAAEKIGHETVTYVSNIYKYYIAYRLILESRQARQESIEKIKGEKK